MGLRASSMHASARAPPPHSLACMCATLPVSRACAMCCLLAAPHGCDPSYISLSVFCHDLCVCLQLIAAQLSAEELKTGGYRAEEMHDAGYTTDELKMAGFPAKVHRQSLLVLALKSPLHASCRHVLQMNALHECKIQMNGFAANEWIHSK